MSSRDQCEVDQLSSFDKIVNFQLPPRKKEVKAKGDPGMEADVKKMIEGTLGEPLGDDFHGALKSGVKLCRYESVLVPHVSYLL